MKRVVARAARLEMFGLRPGEEREREGETQAVEGLCRLLIRLVRFTASIWYLAIFDASSQAGQAWECDRLSKQPDRDAMEFVLAQTRRRARLFLFYLVLDTCSAPLFVLATQFCSGTLSPFTHSSVQVSFGFCSSSVSSIIVFDALQFGRVDRSS